MIRRLLLVGKRLSFSSFKETEDKSFSRSFELYLPIDKYWEIDSLLQTADYLIASNESVAEIQLVYNKIFKKAAPFAMKETDRSWLFRRSNSTKIE
ncbi:MAG: hypothetical protein HYW48_04605 [Deltaproteobacteria bacterium]|nr:hypothetical protein [Deltaproteobacteria bacterium]